MAKDSVYEEFRLVQDDSSHWYAIPADITSLSLFEVWCRSCEEEAAELSVPVPDFEQYRLNMHPSNYTFTNLQESRT